MIDLDRASLDRVLPSTAGPADWDDVMSRFRSYRVGRRRRALAVAMAALVAVVATASAIGSVRDFILDRGFIGLPPTGATPSAPESGELVVHWEGFAAPLSPQDQGKDTVRAWVFADGRIISDRRPHDGPKRTIPEGANEFNSGYLERRLTPEGLELVGSAVDELFDRSRALLETFASDDPWPFSAPEGRLALFVPDDHREDWGAVEVPGADGFVRLRWQDLDDKPYSRLEGPIATAEQLSALRRVEALLTEPTSVLRASAWAVREARAYVPSYYAVCIDTSPPKDASQVLSLLPKRAAELLRDESPTRSEGDVVEAREGGRTVVLGRSVTYCYKVETEKARAVADALSVLDPEPGWGHYGLAYRVAEAVDHLNPTKIRLEPHLPDGQVLFSAPSG